MSFHTDKKVVSYAGAKKIADRLHQQKKRIVFVSGSYDIPHAGHAYFFNKARRLGDVLFVSVGSDKNIKKLKGPSKPVLSQKIRAIGVASFESVDYAILEKEKMPLKSKINWSILIKKIRPQIFALNNTDSAILAKRKFLSRRGIKLELIDITKGPDISTTKIIEKVKASLTSIKP